MKKEDTHRIVIEANARYSESLYNTEKELETLAVKNKYALFGESTIYFVKNAPNVVNINQRSRWPWVS